MINDTLVCFVCDILTEQNKESKRTKHDDLLIYLYVIYTQGFYEIYEEKKNMLYLKFCEFKIFRQ